jgi:hypothetical protein
MKVWKAAFGRPLRTAPDPQSPAFLAEVAQRSKRRPPQPARWILPGSGFRPRTMTAVQNYGGFA